MTTDKKSLLVDRDRLNNASRERVASLCVDIFDHVQGRPHEDQLLGLFTAAVLIAEAAGHDPSEVYTISLNIMRDKLNPTGRHAKFDALGYHLRTEVLA